MPHKIKNWEKLQHYKNRRPPWIRLYRDVLDDPDFFDLSGDDFRVLVMLWLVASEDPALQGYLPASNVLAFRLRMSSEAIAQTLTRLNHWIILDASDMLASCLQYARPDQIRADQIRSEEPPNPLGGGGSLEIKSNSRKPRTYSEPFNRYWVGYPTRVGKDAAWKVWERLRTAGNLPSVDQLLAAIGNQIEWRTQKKARGEFCPEWPHPSTWLNQGRWEDEVLLPKQQKQIPQYREFDPIAEQQEREACAAAWAEHDAKKEMTE